MVGSWLTSSLLTPFKYSCKVKILGPWNVRMLRTNYAP